MKRCFALLLSLCLLALVGCGLKDDSVIFTGKVLGKFDSGCLLEVTNSEGETFAVGEQVVVHINIEDCPEYAAGDHLTVSFDGTVAVSYPPQIYSVHSIKQTDALGNSIE